MKYDEVDGRQFYRDMGEYTRFKSLMNKLNEYPVRTDVDEHIKVYNDFCTKSEVIKANLLSEIIHLHKIEAISDYEFNKALDQHIPKCNYDIKTEVFTMEFNFVPHIKSMYSRDVWKIKNALVCLVMEGIKRMDVKPNYDKEPMIILFTISNKYSFDVDNVEIKYVIDAMRYSKFFYDDSYDYVSYMVEGKHTDGQSLMTVKVVKKSDLYI